VGTMVGEEGPSMSVVRDTCVAFESIALNDVEASVEAGELSISPLVVAELIEGKLGVTIGGDDVLM